MPADETSRRALTHVDESGEASMVDVGEKSETVRQAVATATVVMLPDTLSLIVKNQIKKGDVLSVARISGIMAAKQTPSLIPLCHTLQLNQVSVEFEIDDENHSIKIEAFVATSAKTGVEMEALTAVSIAALTIYDMCKAVDRAIHIEDIKLLKKTGGKSGDYTFRNSKDC
ncbi:MAG: cyclic pyranopterin monophosphate synthase MoaC [Dehalococcoidia bacterium]